MTRRKLAVPMVAALVGGAVTAAGMLAGSSGNNAVGRQQGLLALDSGESFSAAELYERAAPSVVSISARTVQPGAAAFQTATGGEIGVSTGSGFVLDEDGRIVTNAHVVSGVTAVQVTFPDGQMVQAEVIGKDEETDLAVLRVAPGRLDLRPLELTDSETAQPGDRVVAIGNPTGLQAIAGTGRISGAERRIEAPGGYVIDGLLETDAVIEPATSGGPLMGADGRVVGITSQARRRHQLRGARRRRPRRAHRARGAPQGDPALARPPRPRGAGRPRGDRREHRRAGRARRRCAPATSCSRSTASRFEPSPSCSTRSTGTRPATPSSSTCCARAPRSRSRSAWRSARRHSPRASLRGRWPPTSSSAASRGSRTPSWRPRSRRGRSASSCGRGPSARRIRPWRPGSRARCGGGSSWSACSSTRRSTRSRTRSRASG